MENKEDTFVLRDAAMESGLKGGCTLSWENLSYKVKDKQILKNLSGILEPGSILAVVGASGAGKSSFLDILAGRKTEVSGKVLVNGKSVSMKHVSRYCTQEDALLYYYC